MESESIMQIRVSQQFRKDYEESYGTSVTSLDIQRRCFVSGLLLNNYQHIPRIRGCFAVSQNFLRVCLAVMQRRAGDKRGKIGIRLAWASRRRRLADDRYGN